MAKDGIKITQIGGGSSYTPDFGQILVDRRDDFPVSEWVLMDIDKERVEIVAEFTRKLIKPHNLPLRISTSTNLEQSLEGSDFVFTTMRVGKSQSRIYDETIPQKHGFMLGQETTAPGGLMMGLRNIPVILDVAEKMEKVSSANAWLINLANPSGMLSEALNRHSHVKFAGLCNGPTVTKYMVAGALKADPKDVFIQFMGLNHLVWMRAFYNGRDVTEESMDLFDEWMKENIPPLRTECPEMYLQKFAKWFMLGPYLRFYYLLPEAIEDHRNMASHWPQFLEFIKGKLGNLLDGLDAEKLPTRAHFVEALEDITLDLYAEGNMQGYELVKNSRGGKGYAEAGLSLASAIWNDKYEMHGVDVPNNGSFYGLERRDVVTASCLVNRAGVFPLAMGVELPRHMLAFVQAAKNYELLAVEAAVSGDYHTALEALIANPLIVSYNQAKAALDELLLAHKDYLPKFAAAIAKLEHGQDPLAA